MFSIVYDIRAINNNHDCPGEIQDVLRHTSSACSSAMSLATNMLDIGKMEEGKLVVVKKPMEFSVLVKMLDQYTNHIFFSDRRISVKVEKPLFPLRFEADHYLIDRVLQNLLTNAAMYTPKGGAVNISFDKPATIHISNTGEPIPNRYRNELFGKYARISTDSSKYSKGLGLFFCKLVIKAHGGCISLECAENTNSFLLILSIIHKSFFSLDLFSSHDTRPTTLNCFSEYNGGNHLYTLHLQGGCPGA